MRSNVETLQQACGLHQMGRLVEAEAIYRRVLAAEPENSGAWHLLGVLLHQGGQFEDAVTCFRRALALSPLVAESHFALGTSLRALGRIEDAGECYRRAIEMDPRHVGAWINLGNAVRASGRCDEAIACYERAVALEPASAIGLSNLGNALKDAQRLDEAVDCHRRAVALQPGLAEAHSNLGAALRALGRVEEAIDCHRRAMQIRPDFVPAFGNFLYSLYFAPGYDQAMIFEEHQRFDDRFGRPLADFAPHSNDRTAERRLRIGYVSSGFREHAQAQFLAPLLTAHDHGQFEIYCFSDSSRTDEITSRLRACSDAWRDVAALSDQALAGQIREDRIDILIDLTMYMEGCRPLLFARKPAPVQACWLAYPGTTGLTAMDYRLTDRWLDPPGMFDDCYSEKSIRLPDAFWCYDPLSEGPAVGSLPAIANGWITFGSLNNFSKMNAEVFELWGRAMAAVRKSRLVMLAPEGSARERVLAALGAHGIGSERIAFVGRVSRAEYLATYQRIDIGLDTLPANGHTTTLDALWMGVPVVTLVGRTAIGRGGVSIFQNLGTPELIAESVDDYVRIVAELAGDIRRLAELRAGLRKRLEQSPLMDGPRFARGMEAAFRDMWREWCLAGA